MKSARQTIKAAVWLLLFALPSAFGQNSRPEFTGAWSAITGMSAPAPKSITEIKQTDLTVALRQVIGNRASLDWSVYPTDGTVRRSKVGRRRIETTGLWKGNELILRKSGPGNAPWRRSTEQQTLSLSSDGRRMTVTFHNLSDEKAIHDHTVTLERIVK